MHTTNYSLGNTNDSVIKCFKLLVRTNFKSIHSPKFLKVNVKYVWSISISKTIIKMYNEIQFLWETPREKSSEIYEIWKTWKHDDNSRLHALLHTTQEKKPLKKKMMMNGQMWIWAPPCALSKFENPIYIQHL